MPVSSPQPDSPGMEELLAEKDELIHALTSQLELAVERLDRLRRAGAERNISSANSEVPSPSSGRELNQRLSFVLDEWDELRPIDRLNQIEESLSKLLELASQRPQAGHQPIPTTQGSTSGTDYWEQTKARLIAEDSSNSTPESPLSSQMNPVQAQSGRYLPESPPDDDTFPEIPLPPRPVEINDDAAALFAAVAGRDQYIHYLTERLRKSEQAKWMPADWSQLQNAPEQYLDRLKRLESMLQEQLRMAEISNSLERADLTRERARLNQVKMNLEMQIKRMATGKPARSLPAASQNMPPPASESPPKSENESRWKRLFSR